MGTPVPLDLRNLSFDHFNAPSPRRRVSTGYVKGECNWRLCAPLDYLSLDLCMGRYRREILVSHSGDDRRIVHSCIFTNKEMIC